MQSCIYEGWVRHRRFEPVKHLFRTRLFMMYFDLAELERVFQRRWFWSTRSAAVAWFRRADHFGNPDDSLEDSVRQLVAERTGQRPAGPIRVLTQLRYFGFMMNPVSFYFCFNESESHVDFIVAEVNNTPWGERHCYVLDQNHFGDSRQRLGKEFHVSPFMPMDSHYRWRVKKPAHHLSIHIASQSNKEQRPFFDVALQMKRVEITGASLRRMLLKYPVMTVQIIVGIYFQALRLWCKRVPFYPHPEKQRSVGLRSAGQRSGRLNWIKDRKDLSGS